MFTENVLLHTELSLQSPPPGVFSDHRAYQGKSSQ